MPQAVSVRDTESEEVVYGFNFKLFTVRYVLNTALHLFTCIIYFQIKYTLEKYNARIVHFECMVEIIIIYLTFVIVLPFSLYLVSCRLHRQTA